jgi:hypothetical protein
MCDYPNNLINRSRSAPVISDNRRSDALTFLARSASWTGDSVFCARTAHCGTSACTPVECGNALLNSDPHSLETFQSLELFAWLVSLRGQSVTTNSTTYCYEAEQKWVPCGDNIPLSHKPPLPKAFRNMITKYSFRNWIPLCLWTFKLT